MTDTKKTPFEIIHDASEAIGPLGGAYIDAAGRVMVLEGVFLDEHDKAVVQYTVIGGPDFVPEVEVTVKRIAPAADWTKEVTVKGEKLPAVRPATRIEQWVPAE